MIAQQFLSKPFWMSLGIALAVAAVFAGAARYYNSETKEVTVAAGSFREPIGHMMSALGVLVPLLIGAIALLQEQAAATNIGLLLSAACMLFLAFVVASWLTFSLASRSGTQDTVTLKYPKDWPYKAASGFVYVGLLTGFLYVAIYFLFEYRVPQPSAAASSAPILIERPLPRVGDSRSDVRSRLGLAGTITGEGSTWTYRTDRSTLRIEFDARDRVVRVAEEE